MSVPGRGGAKYLITTHLSKSSGKIELRGSMRKLRHFRTTPQNIFRRRIFAGICTCLSKVFKTNNPDRQQHRRIIVSDVVRWLAPPSDSSHGTERPWKMAINFVRRARAVTSRGGTPPKEQHKKMETLWENFAAELENGLFLAREKRVGFIARVKVLPIEVISLSFWNSFEAEFL